jgi:hypothetical protein
LLTSFEKQATLPFYATPLSISTTVVSPFWNTLTRIHPFLFFLGEPTLLSTK